MFFCIIREFTFAELEIGVDDHGITQHPDQIDDALYARRSDIPEGVNDFPGEIETEGIQRDRIGLILEALADAVDIDEHPADST